MSSTILCLETKEQCISEPLLSKIEIYLLNIELIPVKEMLSQSSARKLERVVLIFYTKGMPSLKAGFERTCIHSFIHSFNTTLTDGAPAVH